LREKTKKIKLKIKNLVEIKTSFELLFRLKALGYDNPSRDLWWWPQSGTFLTAVSAVLTQNVAWNNVERSLANLQQAGMTTPQAIAHTPQECLETLIRPSGFFRNKARNLIALSQSLLDDFGSFGRFVRMVDRDWLLARRGIGSESADAILNYACYQEAFVVDSYTARLLEALGVEAKGYDAVQRWCIEGLSGREGELLGSMSLAQVYARSHGMIVEYCKTNKHGRSIDVKALCG
jgi:endonuclease-3 related protein